MPTRAPTTAAVFQIWHLFPSLALAARYYSQNVRLVSLSDVTFVTSFGYLQNGVTRGQAMEEEEELRLSSDKLSYRFEGSLSVLSPSLLDEKR